MHQMIENTHYSLEDLQSGDRDAFEAIVDEYSPKLHRLALRMLGDPFEAEDVLQETFLKAYKNIGQFEGRSQFGTWLYRIAANEALMRLRKNAPDMVAIDEPIELPDGNLVTRELKDWCCLPEAEFMTGEAQSKLDSAIAELSPALRSTFVLRDLQGLSTRESAEILNISEAAIKTRLLRARLQLRDSLSTYFESRVEGMRNGQVS
jgi:RNA polymerase sigma-70 factor (ECF subfamily)